MAFDSAAPIRIHKATLLTANEYAARQAEAEDIRVAKSEAERITEAAQAEAARIVADAQARADELDAEMRRIADQELGRFVETHAIDEAARAVQQVLETSSAMKSDFDALGPWFSDFVETALERITGELPKRKLWAGIIREGLKDSRERWSLTLRCHPKLVDLMNEVLEEDDKLAEAIVAVEGDRDLPREACYLVSKKGVLDISVKTQVKTLVRAIEYMTETPQ
ncbi:MAG: hypothetical protein AAF841_00030 [Pseudomonadota bacterium]